MQETPRANRIHIGFFGKRNSGKSTLLNALAGQEVSIASEVAGTTTDPVRKSMEIHGLGACVLVDTAGYDDIGELGQLRVEKTKLAANQVDIAVLLFQDLDMQQELQWFRQFQKQKTAVVCVVSRADCLENTAEIQKAAMKATEETVYCVSAKDSKTVDVLRQALIRALPEGYHAPDITGDLVQQGDLVLLVMPQDIQAPKGRLILPQVQTLRELLEKKALIMSVTTDQLDAALQTLCKPPKLIITDSQVFRTVYDKKPPESLLTSFSILFAAYKGDLQYYTESASAIAHLSETSKVLIAECCTHAPLQEDIGRVKLPRLLRKRIGEGLTVDIVSGTDFPADLTGYDLIIQCGACMFNRKYVLSRIEQAKKQQAPMSNYGVVLAYLNGILGDIVQIS